METLRTIERKDNASWTKVQMKELVPGDVFRMFEPTGEPVGWKGFEWKVIGDPYTMTNENGVRTWGIDVEEILEENE